MHGGIGTFFGGGRSGFSGQSAFRTRRPGMDFRALRTGKSAGGSPSGRPSLTSQAPLPAGYWSGGVGWKRRGGTIGFWGRRGEMSIGRAIGSEKNSVKLVSPSLGKNR